MRRVDKAVIVRVDQERAGLQLLGFGDKRGQVGNVLLFQHPLEQPQPHDVFQYAVAAFGTAFVGNVCGHRGIAGVRGFALKAHQRPGAGREVSRVFACKWGRYYRAGGIVAGDGNDGDCVPLGANPVTDHVTRVGGCAEPGRRRPRPGQQMFIPAIRVDVDQLRGGGVGIFPVHVAGQAIAQVVRDQQRMGHVRDQLRLLLDQSTQLIKRVKRQKLNAAAPVDVVLAKLGDSVRHQAVGAAVAIRHRQADALAMAIKQNVVHAPGINADAVDANAIVADVVQSGTDLCLQGIDIPGIKTVLLLQAVGETVHFAKRKRVLLTVPAREHYAAAGCA